MGRYEIIILLHGIIYQITSGPLFLKFNIVSTCVVTKVSILLHCTLSNQWLVQLTL
jgi:hypothetical protein